MIPVRGSLRIVGNVLTKILSAKEGLQHVQLWANRSTTTIYSTFIYLSKIKSIFWRLSDAMCSAVAS